MRFVEGDTGRHHTPQKDRYTLLFAGRLVPEKGAHVLIEAFSKILRRFPEAHLTIAGGATFGSSAVTDYVSLLHAKAASLQGNIEFLGAISQVKVQELMRQADVFICPSLWDEPLGMVNVEAMAAGTPVVAFSRGGIPETVADTGVLISEIDTDALQNAICELLSSPSRREQLAKRGLERARKLFDWNVLADEWKTKVMGILRG